MLLRRVTKHVRDQNWFAVLIDFVIVVVGVFIGIQVANWNDEQGDRHRETIILQNIANDIRSDIASYEVAIDGAYAKITVINHILKNTSLLGTNNFIAHANIDGVKYEEFVDAYFGDLTKEFEDRVESLDGELWGVSVLVGNVQPSTTAFDALASGGELGLLRDDGLVKDLQKYRYLTKSLVKAQDVTFRPARGTAIEIGLEYGLTPYHGTYKAEFFSVVSDNPKLLATLRTQLGWAQGHLTMLGAAHISATSLLEQIELQLGITATATSSDSGTSVDEAHTDQSCFLSKNVSNNDDWVFFDLGNTLVDTTQGEKKYSYLPGALNYLAMLKKSGYKLGLISNIPVSWGSNFDERLFELKGNVKSNINSNLTDFPWNDFELIILPNTVKDYKPNPNMFLKAYIASKKSNNIVYFQGENEAEILAARKVGFVSHQVKVENDKTSYITCK